MKWPVTRILEQPLNNFKVKLGEEFWTSMHYVHDICSGVNFFKKYLDFCIWPLVDWDGCRGIGRQCYDIKKM